jgi:hypothetical protein
MKSSINEKNTLTMPLLSSKRRKLHVEKQTEELNKRERILML